MTPDPNPVEPCDVKGHLKDQGKILLAIAGLVLAAAIGVLAINAFRWLVTTNPNLGEIFAKAVTYSCFAMAGFIVLALVAYILYLLFEPSIDLLRCLQRQRRQQAQN